VSFDEQKSIAEVRRSAFPLKLERNALPPSIWSVYTLNHHLELVLLALLTQFALQDDLSLQLLHDLLGQLLKPRSVLADKADIYTSQ
jgi:hypothetical protein